MVIVSSKTYSEQLIQMDSDHYLFFRVIDFRSVLLVFGE